MPAQDKETTADKWVGQTIAGKYRVEALLGQGGMGLVLHARHVRLDEEVAIKLLLPSMMEVPGMKGRFEREARAASKIKSRHVARVTDVDMLPDGVPYMVMEYLDGMSLASLRKQRGALEIADAVRYVLESCDAIAEAHALGIVHRDLKPANLFLARGRDGKEIIKVLDFGISKVDAPGEVDTTKTGEMMGSPKYMSPEQMMSMHDVDRRSDIWSLGAILYDLTTGRTPFVADTLAQLCAMVLHTNPPSPRQFRADLPEALEAIILRCLSKDPAKRFDDVAALVAALVPFAPEGAHIAAPRSSVPSAHRLTGSGTFPVVSPVASVDSTADAERSTAAVPSPARVLPATSGTPPSGRGATVSVWNSASADRSPARRVPRMIAAGVVVVVAILALAFVLLRTKGETTPLETTTASAPSASPLPSSPTAAASVSAAPVEAAPVEPPAPASQAAPAAPQPSLRGPLHPVKKAVESEATQGDPFGGRRR